MAANNSRTQGISIWLTLFLVVLTIAVLLWRGWTFYPLNINDRVDHEDFRILWPSGTVGYGYGIVATFLIIGNLLYLLRRKLARFRLGAMTTWLDLHVLTGLLAGVFVAFHSSFQLRTPIATATAVALAVAIASGILGRLLYVFAPDPDQQAINDAITALDKWVPGSGAQLTEALDRYPPADVGADASLLKNLATIRLWRWTKKARKQAVHLLVENVCTVLPRTEWRKTRKLGRVISKHAVAEVNSAMSTAILRSWRGIHRFFAIFMVLTVVIHIGVAWYYGYHWIFSE